MQKFNDTQENLELLKAMYLEGKPLKEIGDYFGIKANSICHWIDKLNIPKRGKGKYKPRKNIFLNQSHDRDYWLGYIFADGHVQRVLLQLCSIEYDAIESYNLFCENQCTITNEQYTLQDGTIHTIYKANLYSVDISEWFMNTFNITSTKHHNLNPNIDLNWDIIRGYFDGDGCAHKKGGFTLNSSSKVWIDRVSEFIQKQLNITCIINQYLECYKLCVWKKADLIKLIPKLYKDANFYIKYKKDRFEPFISNNKSKQGELLEDCDVNQQPSQPLTKLEGSETNS